MKRSKSTVAVLFFVAGSLSRIRLLPIDLNFEAEDGSRGRPQLASPELGKRIIEKVERRSRRFRTQIYYDPAENVGEVRLHRARSPARN